jgi:hypothetical protein
MLPVLFVVVFAGCPPGTGGMVLGGDAQLVGTWEGTSTIQGVQFRRQLTFDGSGNYVSIVTAVQDNSSLSTGGKWYVNPGNGCIDIVRQWIVPDIEGATGTVKAFYEVNGGVVEFWNNPINMDRPVTRESAAVHEILSRKTNKLNEPDSIAGTVIDVL